MFASTARRVAENTDEEINLRIRARMRARVMYLAERPDLIPAQLAALDREWDIERILEANAAALSPNYWTLLAMRFVSGLPHGAFFGVGSIVAERVADKGRLGRGLHRRCHACGRYLEAD